MELSHFGAKVLYAPTVQPVRQRGIPMWIKNTFAPADYGTLVEVSPPPSIGVVRGLSSIGNLALLNLEGSGMVGVPGFSARLFAALARARINVVLITQSSSEHSICVGVSEGDVPAAQTVVNEEFAAEITAGRLEPLRPETGLAIVALVGAVAGLVFGVGICWIQQTFHVVSMGMATSVVDSYPVKMQATDIIYTCLAIIVITLVVSIRPAVNAGRIELRDNL